MNVTRHEGERAFMSVLADDAALGKVLADLKVIDPAEIDFVRTQCEGAADPAEVLRLASGIRQRLGELLCDVERITPEQLQDVLAEQHESGERLGAILVRKGLLNQEQLEATLSIQAQQDNPHGFASPKLGEVLIASGAISRSELSAALERQKTTGRRLGEELIAAGLTNPEDIDKGLNFQRKLTGVIFAIVLTALTGVSSGVKAAQQRATLGVSAIVVPAVKIERKIQVPEIDLTAADVARGYVDVRNGSQLTLRITKNSAYVVDFFRRVNLYTSVEISGVGSPISLDSNGGTVVVHPPRGTGRAALALDYRFNLNANAAPGRYPWPLAMQVRAFRSQ